jgi:hypothetical protein
MSVQGVVVPPMRVRADWTTWLWIAAFVLLTAIWLAVFWMFRGAEFL